MDGNTHYKRKQRISITLKWLLFFTYVGMYFSFMDFIFKPSEVVLDVFYALSLFGLSIKLLPYDTDIL